MAVKTEPGLQTCVALKHRPRNIGGGVLYLLNNYSFPGTNGTFNHRFRSLAFPIPKTDHHIRNLCHLTVSNRSCFPAVSTPVCRTNFHWESMFFSIDLPYFVRTTATTGYKNWGTISIGRCNALIYKCFCYAIIRKFSASRYHNSHCKKTLTLLCVYISIY